MLLFKFVFRAQSWNSAIICMAAAIRSYQKIEHLVTIQLLIAKLFLLLCGVARDLRMQPSLCYLNTGSVQSSVL